MAAKPYTNAQILKDLAQLNDRVATTVSLLAQGAWNPAFCSANGHDYARRVALDLGEIVNDIKKRAMEGARAPAPPIEAAPQHADPA
jgi:hypothetical protein